MSNFFIRNRFVSSLIVLILGLIIVNSCKKETSCEGCAGNNKPPIAIAGPDQAITLPADSVLLDGTPSSDPDGTISEWLWKKISGPASLIMLSPNSSKTNVENLVAGVYLFELKVTDNKGLSAKDTLQVVVNDAGQLNRPPIANAGADQTIVLPAASINLNGSASTDPDNNISAYTWTKISGPQSFIIANPNVAQTPVTDLVEGVYQFELNVTDAGGLFDKDTVRVIVSSQSSDPLPCTTSCGKIVFVSDRDGNMEIYSCDANGSNITRLTNDPAADMDPAWSPDGNRIAFIRAGNLCIMNANGTNMVQRTFTNDTRKPTWSPDGTKIAFTDLVDEVNNYGIPTIMVMDLASAAITAVPNSLGSTVVPAASWSPDGTKLAFHSDWNAWDFISDIFSISLQGTGFATITSQFFNDHDYWKPSWSPDGMKLSVTIHPVNNPNAGSSVAVMNANGTGLTIIKTGIDISIDNEETRTTWSPDGRFIAYTSNKIIRWVAADGSASGAIITNGWDADWR